MWKTCAQSHRFGLGRLGGGGYHWGGGVGEPRTGIIYTYISMYVRKSLHPSIHPSIHACMHACEHAQMHTRMQIILLYVGGVCRWVGRQAGRQVR